MLPMRWVINNIFVVFICLALSCQNETHLPTTYKVDNKYKPILDSIKQTIQNGDIILRLGNDVTSSMFASLNNTNKSFSHCGIAFKIHDTVYVYHSIGGEDNPNEKLKKDTIEAFVSNVYNKSYGVARYLINNKQIENLYQIVDSLYKKQIPFDMDFDLKTDNKLYCAEMLYKTLKWATKDSIQLPTTKSKLLDFVSTDNIYMNKYCRLLCEVNYN
jgi:hypothetical protein